MLKVKLSKIFNYPNIVIFIGLEITCLEYNLKAINGSIQMTKSG